MSHTGGGAADPSGDAVRPAVAVAAATVGFFALTIAALGVGSLLLDADVIDQPGLGQIPGIAAMLFALGAFAGVVAAGARAQHPSYGTAPVAAVAAFLAYAAGLLVGVLLAGSGPAAALAVSGGTVVGWVGAVVAATALVCGWSGIALVRTRAHRPRWQWERDEEE